MRNKIHYSPKALRDLDEIWDYIVFDLSNSDAAERIVDSIQDAIDGLEVFPEQGKPLSAITNIETDYRFLVCGKYLAFYLVKGNDVYIDRILYGGRDYLRILFGDMLSE